MTGQGRQVGRTRLREGAAPALDRLISQRDAAAYLGVSVSYLRASSCPKVLLPGTGPRGKPLVRYRLSDIDRWVEAYRLTPR